MIHKADGVLMTIGMIIEVTMVLIIEMVMFAVFFDQASRNRFHSLLTDLTRRTLVLTLYRRSVMFLQTDEERNSMRDESKRGHDGEMGNE